MIFQVVLQFIAKLFKLIDNNNSGKVTVVQMLDSFGKLTWLVYTDSCAAQ